jgi:hypothetical protein
MRVSVPIVVFLASCASDQGLVLADPVSLVIDSPTYGEFLGDGPIEVVGHVTPTYAVVKVEGQQVAVDRDGRFTASIPFEDRYRIIDAEAAAAGTYQRVRVPVFDGADPVLSWPGAITLRVTPDGLTHIGDALGAVIDATGWADMLAAALPTIGQSGFELVPVGITHSPSAVVLTPATGGVDTAIALRDVTVHYQVSVDIFGQGYSAPVDIGFGTIAIGALAVPAVDDAGLLSITLTNAAVSLDDPHIEVFGVDSWLVDLIVGAVADWVVEPIGELIVDLALGSFGTIPLGGPFAFSQDLVGTPIDIRLAEVWGDTQGLGAGLGVGIGEPAPTGHLQVPVPGAEAAPVHLAIGLHEGLLQTVLAGGVLDMLTQDIQLPGTIGELIGNGVRNLPGGDSAPAGDGWCLALHPGSAEHVADPAEVVRLQEGVAPFATLYLPDLDVSIGISQGGVCTPWLEASMAAKIGLVVDDGTKISVDIGFVEGAVTSYAATSDWEEGEVIAGLSTFLNGAMGLLGGMVSFDLADLTGVSVDPSTDPLGVLGDLSPAIVSSTPMTDAQGVPVDGMYSIGIQLWEE